MAVYSVITGCLRPIKVQMLSKEAIARIGNFLLTGKPFGFAQEMDESWADEEQWEDPNAPVEEQTDYGSLSQEDFVRGEMILGLMGHDVEGMSTEEKVAVLSEHPDYLRLVPKFDVQGQWVHVLREDTADELEDVITSMLGKNQEICVTDANLPEFWNFTTGRRFGLVFEGRCKVLWNADMYSYLNESGELVAVGKDQQLIDKLSEGWVNLSEVKLVGLRVKEDEDIYDDAQQVLDLVEKLGITWNEGSGIEKVLLGVEAISFEEAQVYYDVPVDFDSPEHLFESDDALPEGQTYQNYYDQELIQASFDGDVEQIKTLLDSGANINFKSGEALIQAVKEGFSEAVKVLIRSGADPNCRWGSPLYEAVATDDEEMVKLLLSSGADVKESKAVMRAGYDLNIEMGKILIAAGGDQQEFIRAFSSAKKLLNDK